MFMTNIQRHAHKLDIGTPNKHNGAKDSNRYWEGILLQDNVAILVSSDRGQCISFREGSKEYPLHPPKDQPVIPG